MKKKEGTHRHRKLSDMTVQEINSTLIEFISNVRRPNGQRYRPDIILYFVYGIEFIVSRHFPVDFLIFFFFFECRSAVELWRKQSHRKSVHGKCSGAIPVGIGRAAAALLR